MLHRLPAGYKILIYFWGLCDVELALRRLKGKEKVVPIEKVSNILSYRCCSCCRLVSRSSANSANNYPSSARQQTIANWPKYHLTTHPVGSSEWSESLCCFGEWFTKVGARREGATEKEISMSSRHYSIFVRFGVSGGTATDGVPSKDRVTQQLNKAHQTTRRRRRFCYCWSTTTVPLRYDSTITSQGNW